MYIYFCIGIFVLIYLLRLYYLWEQRKSIYKDIPGINQLLTPPVAQRLIPWFPFLKRYHPVISPAISNPEWHNTYGNGSSMYKMVHWNRVTISINDIEFARYIAGKVSDKFSKEGILLPSYMNEQFGQNIFSSIDTHIWKRHHRHLFSMFTQNGCSDVITHSKNVFKKWKETLHGDNRRNIFAEFPRLFLQISALTLFGCDIDLSLADDVLLIMSNIGYFQTLPLFVRRYYPFGIISQLRDAKRRFDQQIDKLLLLKEDNLSESTDIISQMMREGSLSHEEIRSNCFALMVAGTDAPATALSFALTHLAMNSHIQNNASEIVSSVLKGSEDISIENIDELEYLEYIMKETLRITPPVQSINRKVIEDFTWKSHNIPSGTYIAIPHVLRQIDSSLFPDPKSFNPDRWRNDRIEAYSWSPFGFGRRICMGITMAKLQYIPIISMILSSYTLSVDKDYTSLEVESILVSKPKKDTYVTFTQK